MPKTVKMHTNLDWVNDVDGSAGALLLDGFDEAIIGVTSVGNGSVVVVYDTAKIIDILIKNGPMTWEDAIDHFDYNIRGAHMGERTPLLMTRVGDHVI